MRESENISRDLAAVQTILSRMDKTKQFVSNITENDFIYDIIIQEATIRQIEVVGEAAKRISEHIKQKFPDFPWKEAMGMRDRITHQYDGIDLGMVWDTATIDFPNYVPYFETIKTHLSSELTSATLWETLAEEKKKDLKRNSSITAVSQYKNKDYLLQVSEDNKLYYLLCDAIEKKLKKYPLITSAGFYFTEKEISDLSHGKTVSNKEIISKFDVIKNTLITSQIPPPSEKQSNTFKLKR